MTCVRTQGFLAQEKVDTAELVDARRHPLGIKDALKLLSGIDELVVAKGRKVERFDLRQGRPQKAVLERLMLGPTGRLRAPTVRVGRTLLVGYDEATYREVLGA